MATPLQASDLDWCRAEISRWLGGHVHIADIQAMSSRLAEVDLLTVESARGKDRFFLKRFPSDDQVAELRERLGRLVGIGERLATFDGLLPWQVVAADAERRLLLTAEMPGEPLLAVHRRLRRRPRDLETARRAWRGVGAWLSALHWSTLTPVPSSTRPAVLAEYTLERLRNWRATDPNAGSLVERAESVLGLVQSAFAGKTVLLTPCHADLSSGNIFISERVGLIDFDDLRFDLPAVDISQLLLELDQLCRVASMVPLPWLRAAARNALQAGYGRPFPAGLEFWLPHIRNLSVFLLTMAGRRTGVSADRVTTEIRYRRGIVELRRTLSLVEDDRLGPVMQPFRPSQP